MAYVLISTDLEHVSAIEETYARILRTHGFTVDVRQRLIQLPQFIETVARAGGKVDAVVLALDGGVPSSSTDPIQVVRNIRKLPESLAFMGAVRAFSVPVVAVTNRFALSPYDDIEWFEILNKETFDHHPDALVTEVIAAIDGWRQSLIEELDYVGYAVTIGPTGELDVSHALTRRRREGEILTDEASPGSLRTGQYLILAQDLLQQFTPYIKLKYLLNNYHDIARKECIKPESVFQRFFEEHPHLVRRDLFDKHWAQPSLRIPGSDEVLRPDFVLRPRAAAEVGTKWQILDLKLPDDPLLVNPRFHAALSAKVTRAIQQLQNYRDYFNRSESEQELIKRFGARPVNPRLAVLIGRRDHVVDGMALDKAQGPRYLDVEILTYDEIIDFEAHRLALNTSLARVF